MSEIEITGVVVIGLASVLGLISVFIKLIVEPVNRLTNSITKLVAELEGLTQKQASIELKLDRHDDRLDKVEIRLARNQIA